MPPPTHCCVGEGGGLTSIKPPKIGKSLLRLAGGKDSGPGSLPTPSGYLRANAPSIAGRRRGLLLVVGPCAAEGANPLSAAQRALLPPWGEGRPALRFRAAAGLPLPGERLAAEAAFFHYASFEEVLPSTRWITPSSYSVTTL